MRYLFTALLLFTNCAFATTPCVPGTVPAGSYACVQYAGNMTAPWVEVREPLGYFEAIHAGVQHAWLNAAPSKGTWRIRLMNFEILPNTGEIQEHFHQVAHSDLSVQGNQQELVFTGPAGIYRYEVECENDCIYPFTLNVLIP